MGVVGTIVDIAQSYYGDGCRSFLSSILRVFSPNQSRTKDEMKAG